MVNVIAARWQKTFPSITIVLIITLLSVTSKSEVIAQCKDNGKSLAAKLTAKQSKALHCFIYHCAVYCTSRELSTCAAQLTKFRGTWTCNMMVDGFLLHRWARSMVTLGVIYRLRKPFLTHFMDPYVHCTWPRSSYTPSQYRNSVDGVIAILLNQQINLNDGLGNSKFLTYLNLATFLMHLHDV